MINMYFHCIFLFLLCLRTWDSSLTEEGGVIFTLRPN